MVKGSGSASGSSSSSTKKKKKVSVPAVTTVNATLGGQGVKDTEKQANKYEKISAAGVVSTADRTAASTSTQEAAKKNPKLRKQAKKAIREAEVYRGTTKPKTKKERRLRAKGEQIERILDIAKQPKGAAAAFKDVPTEALRQSVASNLRKTREKLEEDLETRGETTPGGVTEKRDIQTKAKLFDTDVRIDKLKKQSLGAREETLEKATIDILKASKKNLKSDNYDPELHSYLKKQDKKLSKAVDKIDRKQKNLSIALQEKKPVAKRLKKEAKESAKASAKYISDSKGLTAPGFLEEAGIRTRGSGDNVHYKIPGIPGWTKFDPEEQGSDLDRALLAASIVAPVRLGMMAKGAIQAGKGIKVAQPALKGVRKVTTPLSNAKALTKGKFGGKAGKGIVGFSRKAEKFRKPPDILKLGAKAERGIGKRAAGRTAAGTAAKEIVNGVPIGKGQSLVFDVGKGGKGQFVVKNAGESLPKAVTAAASSSARDPIVSKITGEVIERVGHFGGNRAVVRGADRVASAIDNALTMGTKAVVTAPYNMGGLRRGLLWGAPKLAGGTVAVGASAAIPNILMDNEDANFAKNIYRDAYDLVVGFIPSTYEALAAGFEAFQTIPGVPGKGGTERMAGLWELMKEHDPLVLAIQGRTDEAVEAWAERPVSTLLELAGAEYAIGRTAGFGMRRSNIPTLRKIGDQNREFQLGPYATKATLDRYYSPDVIRAAIQKHTDKKKPLEMQRAELAREVLKRVDEETGVFRNETARMINETQKEFADLYKKAEAVHASMPDALPFMVSRIARSRETVVEDLRLYRDDLLKLQEHKYDDFRNETINVIERLLKFPNELKDKRVWDSAEDYIKAEASRQEALIKVSALSPHQAEFAKWIPYMVRHLNAKQLDNGNWEIDVPGEMEGVNVPIPAPVLSPAEPPASVSYKGVLKKDLQETNHELMPGEFIAEMFNDPHGSYSSEFDPAEFAVIENQIMTKGLKLYYNKDDNWIWFEPAHQGIPNNTFIAALREMDDVPVSVIETSIKKSPNYMSFEPSGLSSLTPKGLGALYKPSEVGFPVNDPLGLKNEGVAETLSTASAKTTAEELISKMDLSEEVKPAVEFLKAEDLLLQIDHDGTMGSGVDVSQLPSITNQTFINDYARTIEESGVPIFYNGLEGKVWVPNHPLYQDGRFWEIVEQAHIKHIPVYIERVEDTPPLGAKQAPHGTTTENLISGAFYMPSHLGFNAADPTVPMVPAAPKAKPTIEKKTQKRVEIDAKVPDGLTTIELLAKDHGVQSAPGFFRMQGLEDEVIHSTKRKTGKEANYFRRSGDAVRGGLFDPTFNSLFSHRMRLNQTVMEAEQLIGLADLFSPFRKHDEFEELYVNDAFHNFEMDYKPDFTPDDSGKSPHSKLVTQALEDWKGSSKRIRVWIEALMKHGEKKLLNEILDPEGKLPPQEVHGQMVHLTPPKRSREAIKALVWEMRTNGMFNIKELYRGSHSGKGAHGVQSWSENRDRAGSFGPITEAKAGTLKGIDLDKLHRNDYEDEFMALAVDPENINKVKGEVPHFQDPDLPIFQAHYKSKGKKDPRGPGIVDLLKSFELEGDYIPFNMEVYRSELSALRDLSDTTGGTTADFAPNSSGAQLQALKKATEIKSDDAVYVAMPRIVIERIEAHAKTQTQFMDSAAMAGFQTLTRILEGWCTSLQS